LAARRLRDVGPAVVGVATEPAFTEQARALAARMAAEHGPGAVLTPVERLVGG
jgi:hypothetical protein